MQALNRIPKILSNIQQSKGGKQIECVFEEYKRNVQFFIEDMKKEISQLINKYEKTISQLARQNERLKNSSSKQFIRTSPSAFTIQKKNQTANSTKYQQRTGILDFIQTANSKLFISSKDRDRSFQNLNLSPILQHKNQSKFDFSREINPERNCQTSVFQINNQRKKHRQQQLRSFLQSGSKNLNLTTQKFMQAVGKGKHIKKKLLQSDQQKQKSFQKQSVNASNNDSSLNRSLSLICDSLDSSFISKRARSQRKKRMGKLEGELQRKRKQAVKMDQGIKKKGISNLLLKLRNNVENSAKQMVPIKSSKLISNDTLLSKGKSNSKVLINPVPIDIQRKSRATRQQKISPPHGSVQKRPQSILKQSKTLNCTIEGLSAIDFAL